MILEKCYEMSPNSSKWAWNRRGTMNVVEELEIIIEIRNDIWEIVEQLLWRMGNWSLKKVNKERWWESMLYWLYAKCENTAREKEKSEEVLQYITADIC